MGSTIETKIRIVSLVAFAGLLTATHAWADPITEKTVAQALFDEGRTALAANHIAEACSKFGESYKLDPSAGTLLNLGICNETLGRTASAYAELNESVSRAIRDQRPEREKLAREHLMLLNPRLSRLTVTTAPGAQEGLVVALDGTVLPRGVWGVAMPVDPGDHTVEATAPGKRAWRGIVTVAAERAAQSIEVPPLDDDASTSPTGPVPPAASQAPVAGPPSRPPEEAHGEGSTRRVLAWTLVGAGVTGVAVGALFGITAIAKWNGATSACPNAVCPSAADKSNNDGAGTLADASTVAFILGGAGIAAGAALLLTATRTAEPRAVRVGPLLGGGVAGVTIAGAL
jgi:hypothetical protein